MGGEGGGLRGGDFVRITIVWGKNLVLLSFCSSPPSYLPMNLQLEEVEGRR